MCLSHVIFIPYAKHKRLTCVGNIEIQYFWLDHFYIEYTKLTGQNMQRSIIFHMLQVLCENSVLPKLEKINMLSCLAIKRNFIITKFWWFVLSNILYAHILNVNFLNLIKFSAQVYCTFAHKVCRSEIKSCLKILVYSKLMN